MVLTRAWRRRLFGALGAAALAPGMLIGALAVLALAGGFASIGVISQAFSGPALPAAERFSPSLLGAVRFPLPTAPGAPAGLGAPRPRFGAGTTHGFAAATTRAAGQCAGGSCVPALGGGGGGGGGGSGGGTSGGGGGRGGGGGGAPASPQPNPTVVDQAAGAATAATSQLPAPLGPLVSQQVSSAASTLDQVAPKAGGKLAPQAP